MPLGVHALIENADDADAFVIGREVDAVDAGAAATEVIGPGGMERCDGGKLADQPEGAGEAFGIDLGLCAAELGKAMTVDRVEIGERFAREFKPHCRGVA